MRQASQTAWAAVLFLMFLFQFNPAPLYYKGAWTGISDEDAYLAHALTIGLDCDLDYSNEPIHALNPRHTAPRHPIGPGLMAAPFVAFFSLIDRWQGNPIIHDHAQFLTSWSLFGFVFSKVFFFFASLWMYFDAGRRIQNGLLTAATIFLLVSGSSVLFYVLQRFAMAHSFEFCAHALVFWASVNLWQRLPQEEIRVGSLLPLALCAEAGVAMNLLIRPSNLNVVLLPHLLIGILFVSHGRRAFSTVRIHAMLLGALLGCLIPVELIFFRFYQKPYPSIFDQYGLVVPALQMRTDLLTYATTIMSLAFRQLTRMPHILFSAEFGLLWSSPLMVFGTTLLLTCLTVMSKWRTRDGVLLAIGVLIYVACPLAVVLLWQTPGMDFGYRYLFSLFPLSFLGYVLWLREQAASATRGRVALIMRLVIGALCVFSILGQLLYGGTARLELSDRSLSLGFIDGPTAKHYESHVFEEMWKQEAWGGIILARLPAYIAIKGFSIRSEELFAAADRLRIRREQVMRFIDVLNRTSDSAPARVSAQISILAVVWLLGSVWFIAVVPLTHGNAQRVMLPWNRALIPLAAILVLSTALWESLRIVVSHLKQQLAVASAIPMRQVDPLVRNFIEAASRRVGPNQLIYGRADVLRDFDGLAPLHLVYRGSPLRSVSDDRFNILEEGSPETIRSVLNRAGIRYIIINTAQPKPRVFELCAEQSPDVKSEVFTAGAVHFRFELYQLGLSCTPAAQQQQLQAAPFIPMRQVDPVVRNFIEAASRRVGPNQLVYGRADVLRDFDGLGPLRLVYQGSPQRSVPDDRFNILEEGSPETIHSVLTQAGIRYIMINTAQPKPRVFELCAERSPDVKSEVLTAGAIHFNYELYRLGACRTIAPTHIEMIKNSAPNSTNERTGTH